MNVDRWMLAKYVRDTYNCLHFSADVYGALTGTDVRARLAGLLGAASTRKLAARHFAAFERLQAPQSPCLVYMRQLQSEPHLGVFIDQRVLHLTQRGPEYLPFALACRHYTHFRYYK